MTITEKIFALKRTKPFDRLRDSEITLIAEIARERQYAHGETIISLEKPLQSLYVVVHGSIHRSNGDEMPSVFGIESLLLDMPITDTLEASHEGGATCLLIAKGHFFTIINECPALAFGFLEDSELKNATIP
jgi:signal-transduction protein with cAMP-binding, CBS, and nucleotidyltransferase domain